MSNYGEETEEEDAWNKSLLKIHVKLLVIGISYQTRNSFYYWYWDIYHLSNLSQFLYWNVHNIDVRKYWRHYQNKILNCKRRRHWREIKVEQLWSRLWPLNCYSVLSAWGSWRMPLPSPAFTPSVPSVYKATSPCPRKRSPKHWSWRGFPVQPAEYGLTPLVVGSWTLLKILGSSNWKML